MKTSFLALALMAVAIAMLCAPPAFARVDDPIFGMSWRPDMCVSPGEGACLDGYDLVSQTSNQAINWANNDSNCTDGQCLFDYYAQLMVSTIPVILAWGVVGSTSEGQAWLTQLVEQFISEQAVTWGASYGGGCYAC